MPRLGNGAAHPTSAEWPGIAQRKLEAVGKILVDAHPGAALGDDPALATWLKEG